MAIQTLVNSLTPLTSVSRDDARPGDVITLNYVGGPAVSVSWSLVYAPESAPPDRTASAAVLSSTTGTGPITFTVDNPGAYLLRQEVNDGGTVTTEFVRVRARTDFARLLLVAAGEKRDDTGVIPVDASVTGWADDQNANIMALSGFLSSIASSGRLLYVDANRGRNNGSTPNNPAVASGFGDYATVTEAITAATSDATVNGGQVPDADNPFIIAVRPGLYEEDLTLEPFVHVVGLPSTGGALGDSDYSVRIRSANTSGSFFVASTPLATDTVHVTNVLFENRNPSPIATFAKTGAGSCYLSNCRIINTGSVAGQGAALLHQQGLLELDQVTIQQQASTDATHLALEYRPIATATMVARGSRFEGPSVAELDPGIQNGSEALFERCRFSQLGGGPASVVVETWASRAAFTDCVFSKDDLTVPYGIRANTTGVAVPGNVHVEVRGGQVGSVSSPLGVQVNGAGVVGTAVVYEGYSEFSPLTLLNGATSQALTRAGSVYYDNTVSGITATTMQEALDYMTVVAGTAFSGVADLDGAYDGFNYATVPATRLSGAGRVITADQGAVEIVGTSTSTLAPPVTEPSAGEGTLAVHQQVLVGAVGTPEMSLVPNKGHGPALEMGSLVWPDNALRGHALVESGQDLTGGSFRNYDLRLQARSAEGSTVVGSSATMGDVLVGGGTSYASGGVNSPDAGSVYLLGGNVDAATAGLAAVAGDVYLVPGFTNAPVALQAEGSVVLASSGSATAATLTGMANFTDAGVPTAGTLTFGTSRGMVQVAFAGGEVWAGVGGVQELLQDNTGFTASWAGGLDPIILTTTDVGPKAEVFFVEDSTGGTLNTFFGNFATTAGATFVPGTYPQEVRLSAVDSGILNLESVLGMTPSSEVSISLGQSGLFISDGTGGAPLADRPYYKDTLGNLYDLTLGGGVSLAAESYVVLAASGSLTSERVLTGTAGQITIADGGAGANVTLSLNSTGVVAGAYANPTLTVDAQGRVTAVAAGTASVAQVVADIATRDALTPAAGDLAYVTDASADATVVSGAATYIYDGSTWLKIAEDEALAELVDLRTLTGTAVNATDLGSFSGSTLTASSDLRTLLQELETAVEAAALTGSSASIVANITARNALTPSTGDMAYVTDASADATVDTGSATYIYDGGAWQKIAAAEAEAEAEAVRSLTGTSAGDTVLGSFSGTTITTGGTITAALQELETAVEAVAAAGGATGSVVGTIVIRNGLTSFAGDFAYVTDASGDATVTAGAAMYVYDGGSWLKVADAETESETDDLRTLTGTALGATDLGVFGGVITNNTDLVTALGDLETAVQAATGGTIVANITARDALTPSTGDIAHVTDASADGTVNTGSASYIWDGAAWQKMAEAETESEVDDLRSLSGVAVGASVLPAFSGTTITTGGTVVAALQELETAVEAASGSTIQVVATIAVRDALTPSAGDIVYVTDASADATVTSGAATYIYDGSSWLKVAEAETESEADDLRVLSGTAAGSTVLPAFSGSTITTGVTIVAALQELETAIEAGTDDQTAAEVNITDAGGLYTGTEVETALQEVGQDAADLRTLTGTADGATVLGAFSGSTITTGGTITAALQELETAIETGTDDQTAAEVNITDAGGLYTGTEVETALQEVGQDAADLRSLTGTADGATVLGAFSGSTITTGGTITAALQELETAIEAGTDDQTAAEVNITDAGGLYTGTEVETALQEAGQDAADLRTLTGTADGATVLGAFSGSTITTGGTITAALQELETAIEAGSDDQTAAEVSIADAGALYAGATVEAALQEVGQDAADLRTLTGTADGATDLGAFSGTTLTSNSDLRTLLQELETAVESASSSGSAGFVVADITARDALTPSLGDFAYVTDASADGTINTGSASYIWDGAAWQKVSAAEAESEAEAVRTLSGTAIGATVLPAFSGTTITTGVTIVAALQELETAVEAGTDNQTAVEVPITDAGGLYTGTEVEAALQEVGQDAADLRSLTGTADGSTVLGAFSGTTITTGVTITAALQELETATEAASQTWADTLALGATSGGLDVTVEGNLTVNDAIVSDGVTPDTPTLLSLGDSGFADTNANVSNNPGGQSDNRATISSSTALETVSWNVAVNDGSRNSRAKFFLTDGTANNGAWGLWESFSSGGQQPFVLGVGSTEIFRVSSAGVVTLTSSVITPDDDAAVTSIDLLAGNGITNNVAGGAVNILAGDGNGTQSGGVLTLEGGPGGATGDGGTVNVTGGDGGSTSGDGGDVVITPGGVTSGTTGVLQVGGSGTVQLAEQSAVGGGNVAGRGRLWVRDDSPNTLMFTDDAGADHVLSSAEHVLQSKLLVPVGLAAANIVDDFHVCAWSSNFTPTHLRAYISEAIAPVGPGNVTVTAEAFNSAGASLGVLGTVNADALVAGTTTTVALTAVAVPPDGVIRVRMEHPGGSPLLTQGDGLVFTITGTV